MTYQEFNLRVKRPITENNYHTHIEPVYNIIEGLDKDFTAELYERCGIGIFKGLKDYCKKLEEAERQIKRAQDSLDQARIAYKELKG